MLPGALARLKATHPDIPIRLQQGRTEELLPLLASGELDLVVGRLYAPALPDQFLREPLWTEPISILARAEHPIFAGPATIDALRRYELVLPTVSQFLRLTRNTDPRRRFSTIARRSKVVRRAHH